MSCYQRKLVAFFINPSQLEAHLNVLKLLRYKDDKSDFVQTTNAHVSENSLKHTYTLHR